MKFMIIRFFIFLITFFLIGYSDLNSSDIGTKLLGDIFEQLNISIAGVEDFIVKKDLLREGLDNTFRTIIAKRNDETIKIEVITDIDPDFAGRYIDEKKYVIGSLYKRIPSAYPGMISNIIECPDKFKPEVVVLEIENKDVEVYILYSTSRCTYGACVDELIKYRGVLVFIYSESKKTLYQVEIFVPKQDFEKKEILSMLGSFKSQKHSQEGREKSLAQEDWDNFKDYNLIIIGIEPLGAKHIGAYGYFRDTTPNIDEFSKDSFLFKNATSPSSWTLPVFMSLFTSLYPSQHKIINKYSTYTNDKQVLSNLKELSPSVVTLAQILKDNGYSTAGFTGDAGVEGAFGYSLGFDIYYDNTTFGGFDLILPMALAWLDKNRGNKFFLFLLGYDVHGRSKLPEGFENIFADSNYSGKYNGTPEEYWELRNLSLEQDDFNMTDEEVRFWKDWYDAKIYEADKKIGEFLKRLDKLGLANKTIIVISSASGNEFYEHKKFDHGYSLYDELIHVPLIIKIPQINGRIIENQVRIIDIMPTVLGLLDIDYDNMIKNQIQGVNLTPLMKGESLQLDAFSETDYLFHTFKRSIRTNDGFKFIYTLETEQKELYNLKEDPRELNNLIEKEKKIAYLLEQKLFSWLKLRGQGEHYQGKLIDDVFRENRIEPGKYDKEELKEMINTVD